MLLRYYYWATALFLLLDYMLGINIRLASLDSFPIWRASYYIICFACLGLMLWRPAWSTWVATAESLITLSMLIIAMGVRALTIPDTALTSSEEIVTMEEITNFVISGGVAWLAYVRGMQVIREDLRHP